MSAHYGRPPVTTLGLPWKKVQIEEVDDEGYAHCLDQFGFHVAIPVALTRAKGLLPAVGDQWVIDRAIGGKWSFAAIVNTAPPEITGSRSANPALASLLEALEGGGLIKDATTLGTGGGGGGVTDHGDLDGLEDDDHPQYALSDGTRGDFASTAQGDLADTAVQPGDLGDAAYESASSFEAAGAVTAAIIAHNAATDPHGDRAYADAHINDTSAAHASSAVSFSPSGLVIVSATDVQAALAQVDAAVDDRYTKTTSDARYVLTSRLSLPVHSSGDWITPSVGYGNNVTPTVNVARCTPIDLGVIQTLDAMYVGITTAGTMVYDLALYDDDGTGWPGTRKALVTGISASTAFTAQTFSAFTAARVYVWLAFMATTVGGGQYRGTASTNPVAPLAFNATNAPSNTNSAICAVTTSTAGSLPSTWPNRASSGYGNAGVFGYVRVA